MTLTRVVLPAPLGPIKPWIEPCSTSSDTPSTAWTPPKCRWTSSRRRSTYIPTRPPPGPDDGQPTAADDALRPEHDHSDEKEAGDDIDVVQRLHEDPGQARHHQGADHWTDEVTAASEHGEAQDLDRARDAILLVTRVDKRLQVCFERSREAGQDRTQDKGDHLVARDMDTLAQRRELVLADRRPCRAQATLGQPPHEKKHDRQADQHEVDTVQRVGIDGFQPEALAGDRQIENHAQAQCFDEP